MSIKKETRVAVFNKYSGHCAYCGRVIQFKDMQVDHFIPQNGYSEKGTDDPGNLMPSCRMCNHYKRSSPLEFFRHMIEDIPRKLRTRNYIYKVGVAYQQISECEHPVKFYFEYPSSIPHRCDTCMFSHSTKDGKLQCVCPGGIACIYYQGEDAATEWNESKWMPKIGYETTEGYRVNWKPRGRT